MSNEDYVEGISKTDACFIELNALGYRISGALNLLVEHGEKLPLTMAEAKIDPELPKNKFMVKSMWEHLILNLYKLIEIHDSVLGKILSDNDVTDLEKCLEPSWNAIKKLDGKIRTFRHSLAHSKELANNYVSFMDMDPDYYQTQTQIIVAANAAVFYISGIFENLTDLYKNSRISFDVKIKNIKKWPPLDEIGNAKKDAIKILTKINLNLKESGYTPAHLMDYD